MIYRTDCGCIASRPEPSPAEFTSPENYALAAQCWRQHWERVTAEHVYQCPRSGYHVGPAAGPTYPRCLICGAEPAPVLDDRPDAYNRFGRHVGACYCRQHIPAGVPTVEIVAGASGVYFVGRDATGEIVQDDRPWQLREGVS